MSLFPDRSPLSSLFSACPVSRGTPLVGMISGSPPRFSELMVEKLLCCSLDPVVFAAVSSGLVLLLVLQGNLRGLVQLYDLDCGKGSCTHAQAACFVQTRLALYRKYSPLLMCVSSVQDGVCTVKMRDVNRESQGQYAPKEATFPYDEGDFPVGMVHHSGFGFLQILSRKGSFHVVEVESGGVIYSTHLSSNLLFFQCCQLLDQGAVCFSRDGDIFYLPTNYPANVMQYLMEYCDNSVVFCVAARCDLPGAEPLFHTVCASKNSVLLFPCTLRASRLVSSCFLLWMCLIVFFR